MNSERCRNEPPGGRTALAVAIQRGEWERIMLHVLVVVAETLRSDPKVTIDDLLSLLEARGDTDDG